MKLLALLAAAAASALAAGCGAGETTRALPEGRFVAVSRSVEPKVQLFGDPVVARVDAIVDTERYDAERIRLVPDFEPFELEGEPVRRERDLGRYTHVHWEFTLRCLAYECLPEVGGGPPQPDPLTGIVPTTGGGFGERKTIRLDAARLVYDDPEEGVGLVRPVAWPAVQAVSRLDFSDTQVLGIGFPFAASVTPLPGATYRVPVALLGAGLLLAALLLLVLPAVLVGRALRREPPPVEDGTSELTPLERALLLVEWAYERPEPERREALEALAVELEDETSERASV
ncbi:MAG TPA: hypothetical protein VK926_08605, partial [Gaiellaceae bacterium]|nr:hypothetical protein [Gaiellaceae bacterium]